MYWPVGEQQAILIVNLLRETEHDCTKNSVISVCEKRVQWLERKYLFMYEKEVVVEEWCCAVVIGV